ncbi:MAG: tRNA (adenosine(37)-N6)-threonylcarbamoyltransferase complex dimerization subunit type 1 TsaB [Calditrichia bacterium]|nr:tRNA (adenosine(37)-N6)-threonylcarbamoyltransferase complex dimerization subunit type 1 TsaB [Calditrichia bacterium]
MLENSENIHLLAIETSGMTSGVFISQNQQVLGQITLHQKNIHSRSLSLSLKQLLDHLQLTLPDVKAIILSAGPGSFTGLRIGYSFAKGIAHSLKLPIIEVPTLDIWAYQLGQTNLPVLSFINAHREEIFYAHYRWQKNQMVRKGDYQLIPLKTLPEIITKKTIISGGDLGQFQEQFKEYLGETAIFPHPLPRQPQGWALLELGFEKFRAGIFSDTENCEPMYLRSFQGVM